MVNFLENPHNGHNIVCLWGQNMMVLLWVYTLWASYQIHKIAGCACAGNAGNVFPRRRLKRKPLVSDPGMHHGTCVTHVPWCMSGSLTCGDGENVPGIPGACAPAILRIWQEANASVTGVLYRISWYNGLHYYNTSLLNIIYGILRSYFSLAYSSQIHHIYVFVFTNESYLIHLWHYLYTLTAETYTESCKFILFITWK